MEFNVVRLNNSPKRFTAQFSALKMIPLQQI
jgi:hypothetical protein